MFYIMSTARLLWRKERKETCFDAPADILQLSVANSHGPYPFRQYVVGNFGSGRCAGMALGVTISAPKSMRRWAWPAWDVPLDSEAPSKDGNFKMGPVGRIFSRPASFVSVWIFVTKSAAAGWVVVGGKPRRGGGFSENKITGETQN